MLSFASEKIAEWDVKKLYNFILNVVETVAQGDLTLGLKALVESGAVPIGVMVPFATDTSVPEGWLLCNGAAVGRLDFADLFAVIGTTWGAGDGSTTFNVPNAQGRMFVGKDGTTEFLSIGQTGGSKTVTLTTAQMPAHTHTGPNHTHSISGDGAHSHQPAQGGGASGFATDAVGGTFTSGTGGIAMTIANTTTTTNNHNHGGVTGPGGTGNTGSAGSGNAHTNLQPYAVSTYIIKT